MCGGYRNEASLVPAVWKHERDVKPRANTLPDNLFKMLVNEHPQLGMFIDEGHVRVGGCIK